MKYHVSRFGRLTEISKLSTDHLESIVNWIEYTAISKLAKDQSSDNDNLWYSKDVFFDKEILDKLKYSDYKDELDRRLNLIKDKEK